MTYTEEQVEWIVREVLRRLAVVAAGVAGDEGKSSPVAELQITDQVITMRSIEGRLKGITRMVVRRKAIVTPAVKDELKQRKVELVELPQ